MLRIFKFCPHSVTMQAQKESPSDMQCKDKFLLQSVITHDGATAKDINAEMVISIQMIFFFLHVNFEGAGFWRLLLMGIWIIQFNKEAGHLVEECKLRVLYVSPPQPPSPVPEGSEEGSSPRGSASDNGNANSAEFSNVSF